jgi:hypothetical protein
LEKFLDSAYANFRSAAEKLGSSNDFTGVLLLAETSKDNWFQRLTDYANGRELPYDKDISNWTFHRTKEDNSLYAISGASKDLLLIAGRQIVTREQLEVLALFTTESFKDDTPIKELIDDIKDKDSIPVIPWGFGKWMGQRGNLLNKMIKADKNTDFFLGDNGNRPLFLPAPMQFKLAQKQNISNLPGSDPLPFVSEFGRAGCFGTIILDTPAKETPAGHLKEMLRNPEKTFRDYGELERPYRFFRNQIASQLRKRFKR